MIPLLIICVVTSALGIETSKEVLNCEISKVNQYRIPNYQTSIRCENIQNLTSDFVILDSVILDFVILNNEPKNIGDIIVEINPKLQLVSRLYAPYYKSASMPFMRLGWIGIKKEHQKYSHGRQAMETLSLLYRILCNIQNIQKYYWNFTLKTS